MSANRRKFLEELDKVMPGLARAFEEAVADIRSGARLAALEAAIERGDIQAALEALRLSDAFFAPLDRKIDEAFYTGGVWGLSQLPPKHLRHTGLGVVRFQGRHPRAEAWVKRAAGELIREITQDQMEMVRSAILRGLEAGRGARSLSLDLIGRKVGNSRRGGLIGLTSKQAEYVQGARIALSAENGLPVGVIRLGENGKPVKGFWIKKDGTLGSNYEMRDRRHDRTVAKAIREGRPLAKADIDKITGRYSDRLLKMRGETIARTESLRALNAGRNEGIQQLVESGGVPQEAVTMIWEATPSGRTRDTHRALNGARVKLGELFVSPSGAQMAHPGDTSHGAGPEEVCNCRCTVRAHINWASLAR